MPEVLVSRTPKAHPAPVAALELAAPDTAHREYAISGRNLNDNWGTVPATVTDGTWSLQYWPNKDLAYEGPKKVRQETYPNTGMPVSAESIKNRGLRTAQERLDFINTTGYRPDQGRWPWSGCCA